MHKIGKEFDFCYGHRVWSQELKEGYSEDMCLACRHLHGHQGKIIVYLENIENPNKLERGMVTDFKHLGWFKKWIDSVLDHKFIMDLNDPLFKHEVEGPIMNMMSNFTHLDFIEGGLNKHEEEYYTINPDWYLDLTQPIREKYEGMVFVNFVPTSENLSKWLCEVVNKKMNKIGIKCSQIQFFETPKSQSNYFEK